MHGTFKTRFHLCLSPAQCGLRKPLMTMYQVSTSSACNEGLRTGLGPLRGSFRMLPVRIFSAQLLLFPKADIPLCYLSHRTLLVNVFASSFLPTYHRTLFLICKEVISLIFADDTAAGSDILNIIHPFHHNVLSHIVQTFQTVLLFFFYVFPDKYFPFSVKYSKFPVFRKTVF